MSENRTCSSLSLKSPDQNPYFYEALKKKKKKEVDLIKWRYTFKIVWITNGLRAVASRFAFKPFNLRLYMLSRATAFKWYRLSEHVYS